MNLIRRLRQRSTSDDRGVTLAEMAVTTGLMSVVMAIFTTGIVQLFQAGNRNELVALTQAQLNTAFLRLDRELRYASGIGPVHSDGPNTFVEYVNTGTANGTPECVQLELYADGKMLRRQNWPQTQTPQNHWTVLANEVNVAKSSFTLALLTENTGFQRLRIQLSVASNPGSGHTEALSDLTFTALNSTRGTDSSTVCPEART